jgi:hypothetical protein
LGDQQALSMNEPGRPLYRLIPFAAAVALFAGVAALYLADAMPLYRGLITWWGVRVFDFPFLDTDTVLSAVRCLRRGVDVYVVNPCDALRRVYDYSPLWLLLARLPVTIAWLQPIGIGVDVAFLLSLLLLPPARSRRDALLTTFGAISSASVYALERGNNDLVIFTLAAVAAALACRSRILRCAGYAAALLAGLLKYYPMTLMALATRERPRTFFAVAAAAAAAVALFVMFEGHDLGRALHLIPEGSYFSDMFGSRTLAGGLQELFGLPALAAYLIHVTMAGATIVMAVTIGADVKLRADLDRLSEEERNFLLVGGLLILSCFFTAQNIGYRAVHLVLVLPGLVALMRTGSGRKFYRYGLIATVGLLWAEGWRHAVFALSAAVPVLQARLDLFCWLVRELMWWWAIGLLATLVVGLLLRSPMGRLLPLPVG